MTGPDNVLNGYKIERPSIWHRLGFGFVPAPRPDEQENMPGYEPSWFIAGVYFRLSFMDRIRILISGRVRVEGAFKTDARISRAMGSWSMSIVPPGKTHHD